MGFRYLTGRLNQRVGAEAVSWWLSGGISETNCIAAYQPMGAENYETSKVNRANPGTYNAADGLPPTWGIDVGWDFVAAGTRTYLTTGITPANDQTWSMIVRFTNAAQNGLTVCGSENTSGQGRFYLWARRGGTNNHRLYGNGGFFGGGVRVANGVIAVAGASCYYNKGLDGTITTAWDVGAREIIIGAGNIGAGTSGILPVNYFDGKIQAWAVYNFDISPNINALTDAINNLSNWSYTPI